MSIGYKVKHIGYKNQIIKIVFIIKLDA